MRWNCFYCDETFAKIKDLKGHIHEKHIMRDHFARWLHGDNELHSLW